MGKRGDTRIEIQWEYEGDYEHQYLRPCDILEFHEPDKYTVRMYNRGSENENDIIPEFEEHIVSNIRHEAIQFAEKKYSNDMFLENAFRHAIGIPSSMMPSAWLD